MKFSWMNISLPFFVDAIKYSFSVKRSETISCIIGIFILNFQLKLVVLFIIFNKKCFSVACRICYTYRMSAYLHICAINHIIKTIKI